MAQTPEYVRLDGGPDGEGVTLVFALAKGGAADLLYLGAALPEGEDLAVLATTSARGRHESQPDSSPVPGLLPQPSNGWTGAPAIRLVERGEETSLANRKSGTECEVSTNFELESWDASDEGLTLTYLDRQAGVRFEQEWLFRQSGHLSVFGDVENVGTRHLHLTHLTTLALPLPRRFTELTRYYGRWAGEMQEHRRVIAPDGFYARSQVGKPGFVGGNWLLLHAHDDSDVLGLHLASNGDHETRIDCDPQGSADGRAVLQMGDPLPAGGLPLNPRTREYTATLDLALAPDRSRLAQIFHADKPIVSAGYEVQYPRKVHLNSWEALGFDLSEATLKELADAASAIGVERFVLDDGWFAGRRDDTTSLGDWHVSREVFPGGLGSLIDHVDALGMDFGIWIEPEMVSPDSDLYRAHPDWILTDGTDARPTMRGQLLLDLSQEAVLEHLFATICDLLHEHPIAYVKWDHNRDIFPAQAASRRQAHWHMRLLERLKKANPQVEFETCASGGGRIDRETLEFAGRVWPSDNNDPVERVRIMQAWAQFLPLEVLGNHVGPSPNPITGRRTDMDFRAKVALFGHMGVEADPRAMSEAERDILAQHIAFYKHWRGVLHTGAYWRLDHPDEGVFAQMVVGEERALAMAVQTRFAPEFDVAPLRLAGLEPEARYRVTLPLPWPGKGSLYLANKREWRDGITLSGRALMTQGLALPLTHPETAWLIALEKLS